MVIVAASMILPGCGRENSEDKPLASKPKLLLLDEPVSALDEPTRREICAVFRGVQREFGLATIHVCHSRREAAAVHDRVGVMSQGRIVQTGPLDELTDDPADAAVRRLLCPPDEKTID